MVGGGLCPGAALSAWGCSLYTEAEASLTWGRGARVLGRGPYFHLTAEGKAVCALNRSPDPRHYHLHISELKEETKEKMFSKTNQILQSSTRPQADTGYQEDTTKHSTLQTSKREAQPSVSSALECHPETPTLPKQQRLALR